MINVDITMTSTIRPEILDVTLQSFVERMLYDKSRYRLIINVDPIGEELPQSSMLDVAYKYFDNILFNLPTVPCFCRAVIWCWSQTTADFVFHLEEDWKLAFPIDIDDMIDIMITHKDLVSLRLNKDSVPKSQHGQKFGYVYAPKISLNPTLFTGNFIRRIVPYMDVDLNPEKQLRPSEKTYRGKIISKISNGIYTRIHYGPVVLDIGREWMAKSKFSKDIGFIAWKVKDENTNS